MIEMDKKRPDQFETEDLQCFILNFLKKYIEPELKLCLDQNLPKYCRIANLRMDPKESIEYERYISHLIVDDTQPCHALYELFPNKYCYQPKPDIAVVPLGQLKKDYNPYFGSRNKFIDKLTRSSRLGALIKKLRRYSDNYQHREYHVDPSKTDERINFGHNRRPYYFISFELERTENIKYLIGTTLSASIMGKIGVVVYNDKIQQKVENLYNFLFYDYNKYQRSRIFENVIFIPQHEMVRAIEQLSDSWSETSSQ